MFIIIVAAWHGVIGYVKGIWLSLVSALGVGVAILVSSIMHRPSAKTVVSAIDYDMNKTINSQKVNLDVLTELGFNNKAIETWYFKEGGQQETIQVQSLKTGEISQTWEANMSELLMFLLINGLIFVIIYGIFQKIRVIIIDVLEQKLKSKNITILTKAGKWCGAITGVLQGCMVVTIWLLLINLIIPLGMPTSIVMEFQNSLLSTTLIDLINTILYK